MGASRKCPDMLGGRMERVWPPEHKPTQRGLDRSGAAGERGARTRGSATRQTAELSPLAAFKGLRALGGTAAASSSSSSPPSPQRRTGREPGERGTITADVRNCLVARRALPGNLRGSRPPETPQRSRELGGALSPDCACRAQVASSTPQRRS